MPLFHNQNTITSSCLKSSYEHLADPKKIFTLVEVLNSTVNVSNLKIHNSQYKTWDELTLNNNTVNQIVFQRDSKKETTSNTPFSSTLVSVTEKHIFKKLNNNSFSFTIASNVINIAIVKEVFLKTTFLFTQLSPNKLKLELSIDDFQQTRYQLVKKIVFAEIVVASTQRFKDLCRYAPQTGNSSNKRATAKYYRIMLNIDEWKQHPVLQKPEIEQSQLYNSLIPSYKTMNLYTLHLCILVTYYMLLTSIRLCDKYLRG